MNIFFRGLYKIKKILEHGKNIFVYGLYDAPLYIIFEKEKLIYIAIPKCGKTSVMLSLSHLLDNKIDLSIPYLVHDIKFPKLKKISKRYLDGSYTIFTVIRDPIERLVSCYFNQVEPRQHSQNKGIIKGGKYNILNYLFGYLKNSKNLEGYLRKIISIPLFLMDAHFCPFYKILGVDDYSKIIFMDLNKITQDFETLRQKFNLPNLLVTNKTRSGKELIDKLPPDLITGIKKIYKKDFELYAKLTIQK